MRERSWLLQYSCVRVQVCRFTAVSEESERAGGTESCLKRVERGGGPRRRQGTRGGGGAGRGFEVISHQIKLASPYLNLSETVQD